MTDPLYLFFFTDVASTEGFLIGIGILLLALLLSRRYRSALALALGTVTLLAATNLLKETLRIPRPESALIETTGYAFPSGHATGALFLFFVVAYLMRRKKWRFLVFLLCALLTLAIGWSRIDLQVHTPLQVLAGYALGGACAALFVFLEARFSRATTTV